MQGNAGPGQGASYAELSETINQLKKENFVLENQKTTVIAYNPNT
jgi:ribosomal protein L29